MPTEEARINLSKYCKGNGIDVGYGGVSITPNTINVDLVEKCQSRGNDPQHLFGNGRDLYWFKDGVLDYVYSSHLLENFYIEEMLEFLKEWYRVLKKGGYIVLYLPVEKTYREKNKKCNPAHKYLELDAGWFLSNVASKLDVKPIYINTQAGRFSFEMVLQKNGI